MTTERSIRNVMIYLMPKVLGYGLIFLQIPIVTRFLSPEDFGAVALAWTVQNAVAGLSVLGLPSGAQRDYFEFRQDRKKLAGMIFSSQLFLYGALPFWTLVMWFASAPLAFGAVGDSRFAFAFFVTFLAAYLNQIIGFYLSLFQNMERAADNARCSMVQSVVAFGATLLFVCIFRWSFMGMIFGSLIGSIFGCLMCLPVFVREFRGEWNWPTLRSGILYGLQVVPKNLTSFVNRFFDKYMLNNVLSLAVVGIYNVGQSLINGLNMVFQSVQSAFQPIWYRQIFDDPVAGGKAAGRNFWIFSYVVGGPLLLAILFAKPILWIMAPPSYSGAAPVFAVLGLAQAANFFGMFVGVQYAHAKKPFLMLPLSVAGVAINVAANILLIPKFGLLGASFAFVISSYISNFLFIIVGQRLCPVVYDVGYHLGLHAILWAAAILTLTVGGWMIFIAAAGCLAAYIFLGRSSGVLNQDNLSKLKGALRIA